MSDSIHFRDCFVCKRCGSHGIYYTQYRKDETSVDVACKCGAHEIIVFESPEKAKTFHRGWDTMGEEIQDQAAALRRMVRRAEEWSSQK